ncbi:MAG: hypothetical protein GX281_04675 [Bacteroidales bacterium]|nr:2'-5' RNA ligase family protein [Bacteroidales bacterium]NLK79993.1 hypothetical protein [Bacteroidales bacterium]
MLSSQVLKIASHTQSFPYTLTEPGIFTSNKQPQVLWLGVDAPVHLKTLKQAVDTMAINLGFQADNRPFKPHLTLGRFRPDHPIPPPAAYRITPNASAQNILAPITLNTRTSAVHSSATNTPAANSSTTNTPAAHTSAHTLAQNSAAQNSGRGAVSFPITCRATRLILYESRLTPSGPIHKALCEAPLKTQS